MRFFPWAVLAALFLPAAATAGTGPDEVPDLETSAVVETEAVRFTVQTVARGLRNPWAIDFLPDGSMLVTERAGTLRRITPSGKVGAPIAGLPAIDVAGQGGLLDVTVHPDFRRNRLVYFTYAEPGPNGTNGTAAARGRLSADYKRLTRVTRIFSQRRKVASVLHFGSRILFDRKGHVFISLGERSLESVRGQAQKLDSHLGKVVRLNEDGSVPDDNPFVGRKGARPEIWTYGHRNPQGLALQPGTGRLFEIEHGPLGGDELNVIRKGRNYGWPVVSWGKNYDGTPVGSGKTSAPGMENAVRHWTPVIAPGGMTFYDGKAFPAWKGNLLIGGLRSEALVRLVMDGRRVVKEERLLTRRGERIREPAVAPDGTVYLVTDSDEGRLLRLRPAP